jgi:hypothetical protein
MGGIVPEAGAPGAVTGYAKDMASDIEIDRTTPRRRDRAARIAVEELTGLALQERGLQALLARHHGEAPLGGPRERLARHLAQSREHAQVFDTAVTALRGSQGVGELLMGVFRSGLATIGAVGASVAQVVTLPVTAIRRGGGEERLLENAGVEGAALANKLVILHAVNQALELSGDEETTAAIGRVRAEALATWDELLEQTPELMSALVRARAHEPSFDFRTTAASDAAYSVVGPGAQGAAGAGRATGGRRREPAAVNGSGA